MDKETLSNYGWIVICVIVLAVMITLATPFAEIIRDAVIYTVEDLITNANEALEAIGSGADSLFDASLIPSAH